ncbi:MAG: potassium transporter KtrB [Bilophila sp.]
MAFSGKITANGHVDLFNKLRSWLTDTPATAGRDWTVVRQDAQDFGTSVVLKNTGLSGTEQVYIGLYAATHTDGVRGGLVCKVYKQFDGSPVATGGTSFFDTHLGNDDGTSGESRPARTVSFVPCWNAAVKVWIWSSKGRVMLVVDCNGLYASAYLGQLIRFSLPSENPWPLACLTDGFVCLGGGGGTPSWKYGSWHDTPTVAVTYGNADADRRSILFVRRGCFPASAAYTGYQSCHQICRSDGVWTQQFVLVPTTAFTQISEQTHVDSLLDNSGSGIFSVPPGTARVLLPVYVATLDGQVIGEMEGVRWCPDTLASAESLVGSYTVFPDVNRVEWHSFMALGGE